MNNIEKLCEQYKYIREVDRPIRFEGIVFMIKYLNNLYIIITVKENDDKEYSGLVHTCFGENSTKHK